MNEITLLSPDALVNSPAFSHVAVIPPNATTIHVGGQNAVDSTGSLIDPDDVAAQSRRALANVESALAAADATLADVVSYTILLVDGVDVGAAYGAVAGALDTGGEPPLVTAAMVAGLGVPGALVEIAAIAAVVR
ncbi:RidA family protein [Solicola gregarius]|uniref:Rid family hydrolase n=1 Tax=Solicola gregarius TaxID=2908642 RepID=A0AA46YJV4_9ACTN|nr:Rid family hydrolase [Solicola gregarius]UYM03388.1 Rid family hydrolase [Solicola gregarius]